MTFHIDACASRSDVLNVEGYASEMEILLIISNTGLGYCPTEEKLAIEDPIPC